MTNYWMVRQGRGAEFAADAIENGYLGVDFVGSLDLTPYLSNDSRDAHAALNHVWLEQNPGKTKIAAGLAVGNLWVACIGIETDDVVITSRGDGLYEIGKVTGPYEFHPDTSLPHRRPVKWIKAVNESEMSPTLTASVRGRMTAFSLNRNSDELGSLIDGHSLVNAERDSVEDPTVFALEKQLEDFLVHNWQHTSLGAEYDIYEVDGQVLGQQYPSDTGPIDILAMSKDKSRLLVVELKKGKTSDVVLGQIQRYMGYVKDELLEGGQTVEGLIIALDDDRRLKRALSVTTGIRFMRYRVSFSLIEG